MVTCSFGMRGGGCEGVVKKPSDDRAPKNKPGLSRDGPMEGSSEQHGGTASHTRAEALSGQ